MGIRACVCHHDQIDRLTEQENMSGSRPVPRDGTTTLIQANKHALILSPSPHRTTTKLKSVRSLKKDTPHHLRPQDASACMCVRRRDQIDRSTKRKYVWLAPGP